MSNENNQQKDFFAVPVAAARCFKRIGICCVKLADPSEKFLIENDDRHLSVGFRRIISIKMNLGIFGHHTHDTSETSNKNAAAPVAKRRATVEIFPTKMGKDEE